MNCRVLPILQLDGNDTQIAIFISQAVLELTLFHVAFTNTLLSPARSID